MLTLLLVTSLFVSGQTAHKAAPKESSGDRKLISIRVTGSQHYKPEQIIATTGLRVGDTASDDDFKKATRELGETGFFGNISYSYAFSPAGTKLEFQVTDNDKLIPVHFENFVWFSDDELISAIHQRLPLFEGQVPVGGDFAEQLSDVLQGLLMQRNLGARAQYLREAEGDDGPITAINFRVEGINIHIRNFSFPGSAPDDQTALAAAAKRLLGTEYLRSQVALFAKATLLPIYYQRGYLKASFAGPQAKVAQEDQDETQVDVTVATTPRTQYKVTKFEWEGNEAVPAQKLQSFVKLQPDQVANASLLDAGLQEIHKFYGTLGRMTEYVNPELVFDDNGGTVAYKLNVHEGEVFHMGDLEILGLDPKLVDKLQDAWTLRAKDAYDSSYPKRFIEQAWKLLPRDLEWTVSPHEAVNEKDLTVDVSLRYSIKP